MILYLFISQLNVTTLKDYDETRPRTWETWTSGTDRIKENSILQIVCCSVSSLNRRTQTGKYKKKKYKKNTTLNIHTFFLSSTFYSSSHK